MTLSEGEFKGAEGMLTLNAGQLTGIPEPS
jgi:hypothetical protein